MGFYEVYVHFYLYCQNYCDLAGDDLELCYEADCSLWNKEKVKSRPEKLNIRYNRLKISAGFVLHSTFKVNALILYQFLNKQVYLKAFRVIYYCFLMNQLKQKNHQWNGKN